MKPNIILLFIWLCTFNGIVKVTVDIPATQGCEQIAVDPVTFQPIPETVKWLRTKAINTHGDEINFPDTDVIGMEGDSLGIGFEFDGGTMGRILAWMVDMAGNVSCDKWEYTFVVPAEGTDTLSLGITGNYYRGLNRNIWVATRRDSNINFNWGSSSPMLGVPADSFSIQWVGQLNIPTTGQWTLFVDSREGPDFYVNGIKKIAAYGPSYGVERWTIITLNAGLHDIRLDHMNATGDAYCILKWYGPGVNKQVIPRSVLK